MKKSLAKRVILLSVLMSFLLTVSWSYFCLYDNYDTLVKQKSQDISLLLSRTTDYVNLYCEGLNTGLLALCSTLESIEDQPQQILTVLSGYQKSNPGKVLSVACVMEDGTAFCNRETAFEIFGNPYYDEFLADLLQQNSYTLHWSEPYISPLTANCTVALYKLITISGGKAAVIMEINLNTMLSSILDTANDSTLTWAVISKNHQVVATSDDYSVIFNKFIRLSRSTIEDHIDSLMAMALSENVCTISNTNYLYFRQAAMWNWTMIAFSGESTVQLSVRPLVMRTLRIGVFHLVLLTLMLGILSRSYSRPIERMAKKIRAADSPLNLTFSEYSNRPDEIGALAYSLDDMIERVRHLSAEKESILEQKRLMEIDVLQGQIHPHFLGNTLACIQNFVREGNREAALSSLIALVRLLNYSVARTEATATLGDELNCANSYVALRKIRLTYSFDYHVFVAPGHLKHHVPRLILQPLIENAIVHGFVGLERRGKIVITSYLQNGKLFICVDDNGNGATQERLRNVMSGSIPPSEHSHGIGVINVFKRLELNDPTPNHCRILTNPDGGVRVLLDLGVFSTV